MQNQNKQKKKKEKKSHYQGQRISDFAQLKPGDYVVHENYGLGIYRGTERQIVDKVTKDYIKIIAIVNFGNRSDKDLTSQLLRETKCKESTNSARKERMKVKKFLRPLYSLSQIHEITDLENVYLTILHINDLKNELERIRCEYSLSLK